MIDKEIIHLFYRLRYAIELVGKSNPEASKTLDDLLDQLEDQLESSPSSGGQHLHLVAEMKQALAEFEVEHPVMTATLNQLMVTLGGMGI
jgi:hypothetical protein